MHFISKHQLFIYFKGHIQMNIFSISIEHLESIHYLVRFDSLKSGIACKSFILSQILAREELEGECSSL